MLCATCQQNEATVHLTTVVGLDAETVHFCKDCTPPAVPDADLESVKRLPIIRIKCEFCGGNACSGGIIPGANSAMYSPAWFVSASGKIPASGTIYWCFDCGRELMTILLELFQKERPELMRPTDLSKFLALSRDAELRDWFATASRRSVQMLRDRRRQDGRDDKAS